MKRKKWMVRRICNDHMFGRSYMWGIFMDGAEVARTGSWVVAWQILYFVAKWVDEWERRDQPIPVDPDGGA